MPVSSVGILGCGWLGQALAKVLLDKNTLVIGSTSTLSKIEDLKKMGIKPFLYSLESEFQNAQNSTTQSFLNLEQELFFKAETLVITLPVSKTLSLQQQEIVYEKLIRKTQAKYILYISSSSVYGSAQGAVDESIEPIPDTMAGERQYDFENRLIQLAKKHFKSLYILRSAGQIGEDRHPGKFLAGRKNLPDGNSPVNMVHQVDLVNILLALLRKIIGQPTGTIDIYNGVARSHPKKKEFYQRAALDLGVEPPEFTEQSDLSQKTSKIVLGDKVLDQLDLKLVYDDLYLLFKK